MNFIAILGRQPELGLVELESRLGAAVVEPFGAAALLESSLPIGQLGGTVKLGRVVARFSARQLGDVNLDLDLLGQLPDRLTFGLSVYGQRLSTPRVSAFGIELKRRLKAAGQASRFVAPKPGSTELTAAQLKYNDLPAAGFELLLVWHRGEVVVALTEAFQDIDWYSRRDYERPARSAKVGMLPPKLAQILVNTTAAPLVADPFCGTGVVLQEAALLGRRAVGSDLSAEMVEASRQNLEWLESIDPTVGGHWSVEPPVDARVLRLPDQPLAIVSEGYLGPNLNATPSSMELKTIKTELRDLYRAVLQNWAGQIPAGTELALCVPAWRDKNGWSYLELVDDLGALGYTMKVFKHVRTPLLYSRSDQIVGRQLLLLIRA